MAVSANLFVTDSLVGSTQVKNTFANISVGTRPSAFLGDQSLVIKLRRNSFEGDVIATTPQIIIRDNAALVSFIANTYTVSEGDLVEFTLTTTNAANNAVLYYSTLDMTPNVDARDFVGSNTGSFLLVDNIGKVILQANTDGSLSDETGETFKLQIRTGSVTGNVVLVSDNVLILDTSNIASYFISQTSTSVVEGDTITFTIDTINVPDGTEVFYTTAGNVRSYNFTTGNTGSRIIVNGSNTINLVTTAIPNNEIRQFALQLREGSTSGQIKETSQSVSILDSSLYSLKATGGTIVDSDGYRTHVFTSSGSLVISSFGFNPVNNTIDYLVVAGGGGGGSGGPDGSGFAGGGGAGGLLLGNVLLTQTGPYSITVGGGGAGVQPAGGSAPNNGGNSSISVIGISSTGGGFGGSSGTANPKTGAPGGSGGGGGNPGSGGNGISGQGNPGSGPGGGGGGRGAAGTPDVGGIGLAIPWVPASYGTPGPSPGRWFAGGGGAGNGPGAGDLGGAGGGGRGGPSPTQPVLTAGTINTGGGGGGSGFSAGGAGGGSGIVVIRYPFLVSPTYALTANRTNLDKDQSILFSIITTNVANNYVLYYRTSGNVISSDFLEANTGSITLVNNRANIILTSNYSLFDEKVFNLQILEGAVDGDVFLTSNLITLNPASAFIQATGGNVFTSIDPISNLTYKVHVFTTSDTFTVNKLGVLSSNVEYVAVAGGGSGGPVPSSFSTAGGGGGAGGMLTGNITINSTGNYSMTIGAGGSGGIGGGVRSSGSNTSIFSNTLILVGGGAGGTTLNPGTPGSYGLPGGSGGGSGGGSPSQPLDRGLGTPGQGSPGGFGYHAPVFGTTTGGGGGGAGGAGGFPSPLLSPARAGNGGAGRLVYWLDIPQGDINPTGPGRYLAGGGGGGNATPPNVNNNGLGGIGGGGRGYISSSPSTLGYANVNTGGGGGGAFQSGTGPTNYFGSGGSGIVVIRYRT